MNTRPALEPLNSPVALSAGFNQDASCFAVGLDTGFCIFNSEPCQLRAARDFNAGVGAAQMLDKSNYLAIVGGGKQPKFPQNKVIIWDDAKQRIAIQIPVLTTVRGVRLTRTHIVAILQNSVRVYKFQATPELWTAFETADNPLGLCCLTAKTLAFPGRTPGQIQLVELATGNVSIIPAHTSPLKAIDISRDGAVLATASITGTLIRVFATSNCAKIAELRRGVDKSTIFDLAFSPGGQQLAVTSDKSTLHIFDVPHPTKSTRPEAGRGTTPNGGEESTQKWGFLGRIPGVPRLFSDTYSFASARFEMGDEIPTTIESQDSATRYPKGILGWTTEDSLMVVGCGRDARWEKFVIGEGEDGKRLCVREGWKRYLGVN